LNANLISFKIDSENSLTSIALLSSPSVSSISYKKLVLKKMPHFELFWLFSRLDRRTIVIRSQTFFSSSSRDSLSAILKVAGGEVKKTKKKKTKEKKKRKKFKAVPSSIQNGGGSRSQAN
jgi:hypothetical protein